MAADDMWLMTKIAVGPCVGPIIGGFLTVAKGWRWNFWFVAIVVRTTSRTHNCMAYIVRVVRSL
jgi:MFS family permease